MKKIRYGVAMSLDGYIAGPNGEADWIVADPEVNFAEIWAQFDTLLMGRGTYAPAVARLGQSSMEGFRVVVASRTLRQAEHPDITVLRDLTKDSIRELREGSECEKSEKDIWLCGGGALFRAMLTMDEVDMVEVNVMPVLLGGGIPMLPSAANQAKLKLASQKIYPSGIVRLVYDVVRR
jgi:dihydrofolate reductase